jgi:ATP-dependent protease ClpP protease subunit
MLKSAKDGTTKKPTAIKAKNAKTKATAKANTKAKAKGGASTVISSGVNTKVDDMNDKPLDITSKHNHIYFTAHVTEASMSQLCKDLRAMDESLNIIRHTYNIDKIPIYLHIKTSGGDLHSTLSAIDCMASLRNPVYTVVTGIVASAGTILSTAGEKRYIEPNAYVLIHELSSLMWGKFSRIKDKYTNLEKLMNHIISHYALRTKLREKELRTILKSDIEWNAKEAIQKGIADEIYMKK